MFPTSLSLPLICRNAVWAVVLGLTVFPVALADESPTADPPVEFADADNPALVKRGQAIYAAGCASCHGDKGQGVEDAYKEPLTGDDSVGELAKLITTTMPEGEPELCVGEDSEAVAAYIHYAFYSEAARIRNRPPRITLTHLTGNQLRQSLADLYARFSGSMWREPKRGINANYFTGARWKRENRKIERVDAQIDFDWKKDGPGEGIDPQDFYIQWRGGLKIDETGRYEIVIRSSCAFMCDFGHFEREFINNRVQSGDKTEFRKSVVLTAGRVYPIQIELYQRKRKTEQPPATISLSWVPPGGIEEVIPERQLLPASAPATFSLQAKLPPDDRSYGYDRGLAVDRQWDASTTTAAIEFAQAAIDELWPRYQRDHKDVSDENRQRLRNFLTELAETAFRGPLDEQSRQFYITDQLDQTADDSEAIKRCVLVILKAPRFLYPGLDADRSPSQRAANQLALTLYDSLPVDDWLIQAAREDKLQTVDQIRQAAERMVNDYRTRGKTRDMMHEWLNLSEVTEVTKNSEQFPEFSAEIMADLRTSLDEFLDDVIWSDSSDYRQLFLADWVYTSPRLEQFYGASWKRPDDATAALSKARVTDHQVGLLSHPYLMTRLAYPDSTSPIHRGVFLIRYMLGRTLRPPKESFTPLSPDLHPDLTTRERVSLQTSPQSCQVCHTKINGLGFALENFDAVGRFRKQEGERPIDPAGQYTTRDGTPVTFQGPSELAQFLANSNDAHRAFVNRAFQHFVKQPVAAYGPAKLNELTDYFRSNEFHIRRLLVEIAVTAATQADAASPADSAANEES
jgi:mono/diheme cytochrome c family protein